MDKYTAVVALEKMRVRRTSMRRALAEGGAGSNVLDEVDESIEAIREGIVALRTLMRLEGQDDKPTTNVDSVDVADDQHSDNGGDGMDAPS